MMGGRNLNEAAPGRKKAYALWALLGGLYFLMTYVVCMRMQLDLPDCDLLAHLEKASALTGETILPRLLWGSDILWHICVWLLLCIGTEGIVAAALVTACVNGVYYLLACRLLDELLPQVRRWAIPVSALTLCIVMPLYIPWFGGVYSGQSSPNVWHSPTQLMVRPFALILFYMTVRIYRRLREGGWPARAFASRGEAVAYGTLMALSVWAKPCFFQAFVPGLGVLMIVDLVRSRGKAFLSFLKIALACVPAAALTMRCYYYSFYSGTEGAGGVEIAPFEYWGATSNFIPLSMLLLLAFPIAVFAADWKRVRDSVEGQLNLSVFLVATAMRILLIEGGERRWHGNFTWAYGVSSGLIWFMAIQRFVALASGPKPEGKRERYLLRLCWVLLILHLAVGIYYYIMRLTGTTQC